jgi:hypothetical protein
VVHHCIMSQATVVLMHYCICQSYWGGASLYSVVMSYLGGDALLYNVRVTSKVMMWCITV